MLSEIQNYSFQNIQAIVVKFLNIEFQIKLCLINKVKTWKKTEF